MAEVIQAQYGYDQDGRLKDLYYPGGMAEASQVQPGARHQYSYDLVGRPLSFALESSPGTFYNLAQNAQYNAAGQCRRWPSWDSSAPT